MYTLIGSLFRAPLRSAILAIKVAAILRSAIKFCWSLLIGDLKYCDLTSLRITKRFLLLTCLKMTLDCQQPIFLWHCKEGQWNYCTGFLQQTTLQQSYLTNCSSNATFSHALPKVMGSHDISQTKWSSYEDNQCYENPHNVDIEKVLKDLNYAKTCDITLIAFLAWQSF